MKTTAPVHIGNLGKSFFIVLMLLTATWLAVSWLFLQDLYVIRPILLANLILAGVLGWFYYKYRYHAIFSYDAEGFRIHQGKSGELQHRWQDFKRLSLVHLGGGRMALRLYLKQVVEGEGAIEFVEIPASDLLLDAFALRDEVSRYVSPPKAAVKSPETPAEQD